MQARNQYGELINVSPEARAMVRAAADKGKIPAQLDDMEWGKSGKEHGKRIGEARWHEVYDYTATAVLLCVRSVEGTRYGQKTTDKSYFLIRKCGTGVSVAPANKALAAKAAKASGAALGDAIATLAGKRTYSAPANAKRTGYKIVAQEGDVLVSVFDGSAWPVGKTRTEAATPDHEGGYYYYPDAETAIRNTAENRTFAAAVQEGKRLVLVEVEASGRHFEHDNAKLCASRIKPVAVLASLI